jgi:glycosyl transferase, family 25
MRAYVINLARSLERRVHVTAELERVGIDYEFVEGVEGRDLDLADEKLIDPAVLGTSWFRPGVAGCAFSHRTVYEKILAADLDWALVLEDDVTLPADLQRLSEALAQHLNAAEVILLNYDSPDTIKMSRQGLVYLRAGRQLALPLDVNQPASSAAYLISRDACKRMTESITPFQARPDDWGHFFVKGALDRIRCVVPMAVLKDPRFGSTIDYNDQASMKSRIVELVTRYNIRVLRQIIAYRRERIWRKQIRVELVDEPFVVKPSRIN